MTDLELKEKITLLTAFDDPAFMMFNDKHTIMATSTGDIRLLAYSRELKEEVFVPCRISVEEQGLFITDRKNIILASGIPAYKQSKKLHSGLGVKMMSI